MNSPVTVFWKHIFAINGVFSRASLSLSDKVAVTEPLPWEPGPSPGQDPGTRFDSIARLTNKLHLTLWIIWQHLKSSCVMLWEVIIKYSCRNQFRLDFNHLIYCFRHEMENVYFCIYPRLLINLNLKLSQLAVLLYKANISQLSGNEMRTRCFMLLSSFEPIGLLKKRETW